MFSRADCRKIVIVCPVRLAAGPVLRTWPRLFKVAVAAWSSRFPCRTPTIGNTGRGGRQGARRLHAEGDRRYRRASCQPASYDRRRTGRNAAGKQSQEWKSATGSGRASRNRTFGAKPAFSVGSAARVHLGPVSQPYKGRQRRFSPNLQVEVQANRIRRSSRALTDAERPPGSGDQCLLSISR